MRSLLYSLLITLAIVIPTAAHPQLQVKTGMEPKLFDRTARTLTEDFHRVRTNATTSCVETATVTAAVPLATSATQRVNVRGYIVGQAVGGSVTGITLTTSIAPMMYAGKVQLAFSDVSGDTVPVCGGYEIRGDSWNGAPQTEIVNAVANVAVVSETLWPISSKSWSRITYVRLSSCGSTDADDLFMVRQTAHVALRYKISTNVTTTDALAVCLDNIGAGASLANGRCAYPSSLSWDTDADANTVNLLDVDLGPGASVQTCPTDGSAFYVKYRASPSAITY
jgi:hypothetical protein